MSEVLVRGPVRLLCIAGLLAAPVGCDGPRSVAPPQGLARCTAAQVGALTVAVTAGVDPTFSWTPACGVDWLRVEYEDLEYRTLPGEAPPTRLAWARVGGLEPLGPPLRYGAPMPDGLPEFFAPEPLVPGRTYTVRLLIQGAAFGSEEEVARAAFVP